MITTCRALRRRPAPRSPIAGTARHGRRSGQPVGGLPRGASEQRDPCQHHGFRGASAAQGLGEGSQAGVSGPCPDGNRHGLLMDFTVSPATGPAMPSYPPLNAEHLCRPRQGLSAPYAGGRPRLRHPGLCPGHPGAAGDAACRAEEALGYRRAHDAPYRLSGGHGLQPGAHRQPQAGTGGRARVARVPRRGLYAPSRGAKGPETPIRRTIGVADTVQSLFFRSLLAVLLLAGVLLLAPATPVAAQHYTVWSTTMTADVNASVPSSQGCSDSGGSDIDACSTALISNRFTF